MRWQQTPAGERGVRNFLLAFAATSLVGFRARESGASDTTIDETVPSSCVEPRRQPVPSRTRMEQPMLRLALIVIPILLLSGCPRDSEPDVSASRQHAGTIESSIAPLRSERLRIAPSSKPGPQVHVLRTPAPQAAAESWQLDWSPPKTSTMKSASLSVPLADTPRRVRNDVNADGRSDLIWRKGPNQVAHWLMNGPQVVHSGGLATPRNKSDIRLSGDFDGDMRADQLWFRPLQENNELTLARRNAAGYLEEALVASVGLNWSPRFTIDLNGDGKSDILWFNRSDGLLARWIMDGTTIVTTTVYTVDADAYFPYAAGDFDGNGRGDLIWHHNASGNLYLWRSRNDGYFDQIFIGGLDKT